MGAGAYMILRSGLMKMDGYENFVHVGKCICSNCDGEILFGELYKMEVWQNTDNTRFVKRFHEKCPTLPKVNELNFLGREAA